MPRQVPYKPNAVTVDISTAAFLFTGPPDSPGEVPDRLDVTWTTPTLDAATQLFETADGGEKHGDETLELIIEWFHLSLPIPLSALAQQPSAQQPS